MLVWVGAAVARRPFASTGKWVSQRCMVGHGEMASCYWIGRHLSKRVEFDLARLGACPPRNEVNWLVGTDEGRTFAEI